MGALQATFLAQLTCKFVRMFVLIESWMSLNMGHLGSIVLCCGVSDVTYRQGFHYKMKQQSHFGKQLMRPGVKGAA